MSGAFGGEHAPVAEERIEDARQAAGERDDRDVFAAPGGNVESPRVEGLRLRWPAAEDGDGGLNQELCPVASAPGGAQCLSMGD